MCFEVARCGAREEFPKNLAHNVEKEHLQNSVLPGAYLRAPLISGGCNLGTWRVTFLMVFLQCGCLRAAMPPRRAAPPCCAAVLRRLLRRRAAAPRSVPSSSDAFAEPPAPL